MTGWETFIYLTFTLPTGGISNTLNENNIDLSFHSDDGQIVKPLLSYAIAFFNRATLANKLILIDQADFLTCYTRLARHPKNPEK